MLYHKECAKNECWVGNTKTILNADGIPQLPEHVKTLKTARLGKQAYFLDGTAIPPNQNLPLIIGNSELDAYDRIMMARLK